MGGYRQLPVTPYNPPQEQSPLAILAGIQQIKNQQAQGTALGLENQQRQIQLQDQQAMTAAMHEWDGKDLNELTPLMVKHGASANAVIGLKGKILEQQEKYSGIAKNDAETGSKNLETLKQKNDLVLGRINSLSDVSNERLPTALVAAAQDMGKQGLLDPQHVQTAQQMAQGDPAAIRKQLSIFAKSYQSQSQQMDQALKTSEIGKNQAQTSEAQANTQKTQQELQLGASPGMADAKYRFLVQGQRMGRQLSPDEQAWVHAYEKQKTLVPQFNVNMQGALLTPEAKAMAAQMYEQTGQLPTGMRSPGMSAGILNTAANQNPNANIAANKASFKANEESLASIQKNLDSVSAFENTANKNLDLFLQQAKKVVDTGSPLINRPLRTISKAMGGADQSAYEAARQVAINEIAKVTGSPGLSGQLTDSARHEVENFNPNNATLAQTYRVAQVLRQDMANRHQSYQQQIDEIKGRMGGQQAQPTQQQHIAGQQTNLPEGKTGKGSDGKPYIVKGGRWVPQ